MLLDPQTISRCSYELFVVFSLQGIAASIGMSNFSLRFSGFFELHIIRIKKIDASQIFAHCRDSVSRWPTLHQWSQTGITGPSTGSPNRLSYSVFCVPGGVGHFADNISIPSNQPTIFHPSQIATIQQTFPLSLCVPLFQQCHSPRIDEV